MLFTRLSGLPFTRAPFPRSSDDQKFKNRLSAFITALTPELAAELTRVAEDFLARHRIRDEPPVWQPPATILDGLDLPGADLASLDLNEVHKLARTGGTSAAAIARCLGTTSDAIQDRAEEHMEPQPHGTREPIASPNGGLHGARAGAG